MRLAALHHDFEHGLDVLAGEAALLAQHLPQLAEYALGERELLVGALEQDLIAAANQLRHAELRADLAQVLIAAAEQQQRFIAAVESDGRFAHRRVRGRIKNRICHRHYKGKTSSLTISTLNQQ